MTERPSLLPFRDVEVTPRGFPAPEDVHERRQQDDERLYIVRLTQYERQLLNPATSGVLGRFCLLPGDDGTYELVRYALD